NLYGDVPLDTITNYQTNAVANRTSASQVNKQIITDLLSAQSLLGNAYVTTERVRPNKGAATALLARVYLYTGDWADAEAEASVVIGNTGQYGIVNNPDSVFLKNSAEAIWQLMPNQAGYNTNEGKYFILV